MMILASSLSSVDGKFVVETLYGLWRQCQPGYFCTVMRRCRPVVSFSSVLLYYFVIAETQGDLSFCQRMAAHVSKASDLPAVCRQFPTVFDDYRRKSRTEPMDVAFQGMSSGSQIQARRSRVMGFEHHAKLHRRMTGSAEAYHYRPQPTK
jgi:hypothetical protein